MTTNQVVIYGLGGPSTQYRVLDNFVIFDTYTSIISEIYRISARMKVRNPSIKTIFAIDNRRGLRKDYMEAFKANSIEGWAMFKDILEREGLLINV